MKKVEFTQSFIKLINNIINFNSCNFDLYVSAKSDTDTDFELILTSHVNGVIGTTLTWRSLYVDELIPLFSTFKFKSIFEKEKKNENALWYINKFGKTHEKLEEDNPDFFYICPDKQEINEKAMHNLCNKIAQDIVDKLNNNIYVYNIYFNDEIILTYTNIQDT